MLSEGRCPDRLETSFSAPEASVSAMPGASLAQPRSVAYFCRSVSRWAMRMCTRMVHGVDCWKRVISHPLCPFKGKNSPS